MMHYSIAKTVFLNLLTKTSFATASKTSLPILTHVLLQSVDGRLHATTTNLDTAITTCALCDVHESGAYAVPHAFLLKCVRAMIGDTITVHGDPERRWLTLASETARQSDVTTIKGMDADEFPVLPQRDMHEVGAVTASILRDVQSQIGGILVTTPGQDFIRLACLKIDGTRSTWFASDGTCMACLVSTMEATYPPQTLLFHSTVLHVVARTFVDETTTIRVLINDTGLVLFDSGTTQVYAKLTPGTYPPIERMIPESYHDMRYLDAKLFGKALRNAVALGAIGVDLGYTPDGVYVRASMAEVGSCDAYVESDAGEYTGMCRYDAKKVLQGLQGHDNSALGLSPSGTYHHLIVMPAQKADGRHMHDVSRMHLILPRTISGS